MLPKKFIEGRKSLFTDEEFSLFLSSLTEGEPVRGMRLSSIKTDISDDELPFELQKIPYSPDGYYISRAEGIGNTPEHHSGMIYMQDPAAMAPMCALPRLREGARVIDLCASPGGKSLQAAALLCGGGFLLSNEYVPKRAKILVQNFERMGVTGAVVTSLDTKEIKGMYENYFDLVILDAPCSAEGMFRKSDEAISEWSEENVALCKRRQQELIENAYSLVKSGGYLLYSTCTYSLSENEEVIDAFLNNHQDFSIVPVCESLKRATRDGIEFEGHLSEGLRETRRFYPHVCPGEGQYLALLQRNDEGLPERVKFKDALRSPSRDEERVISDFFKKNLTEIPKGKIQKYGENLVLVSHTEPIPSRSVFSAGVLIGRVEKGNLFPSHQFFSAYGKLFKNRLILPKDDERIGKYLHGEEIDAPEVKENGWCAVIYVDAPLGGGKVSSGRLKNHYPKGLRR